MNEKIKTIQGTQYGNKYIMFVTAESGRLFLYETDLETNEATWTEISTPISSDKL